MKTITAGFPTDTARKRLGIASFMLTVIVKILIGPLSHTSEGNRLYLVRVGTV